MTDHLGSILKKIRQSKKYTQKYISSNQFSQSSYSKIESGEVTPTINNFFHILKRLDVSYDEVLRIKAIYDLDPKQHILNNFSVISSNVELGKITELKNECIHFLEANTDVVVQDILWICESLVFVHEGKYKEACIYAEKVWKRLSKMDSWYLIELKLINNILFFFPPETQISITQIALKKLADTYENLKEYTVLKIAYLLNITLLLMHQNRYNDALTYAEKAMRESVNIKKVDLISISMVRKGIILYHLKNVTQGLSLISNAININRILGNVQLEKEINEELHNFKIVGVK
ncbi:helix-turn-helix domain-containing protein [Sporolactobacillus spathodeae]|uniref:Rgg/GadR/MutR family transcriptional activator n=1 Tax=Sporolactobacillus spathodeae TaxID=1465502 RepID=A0ABS2QB75_9BACL|nr:Rgg/GadR/MutR family transcriptional regulator [Sporolactobacillus spathodeae]MBM7658404.1 Rgg/GadR/MutR family transcriptional activator [Sporolactobacillus spathodeae]